MDINVRRARLRIYVAMKKALRILGWVVMTAGAPLVRDVAPTASHILISEARAADSCTGWMPQPNGCSFRTCVDDKGRQYCEEACGRNAPTRVKCR